MKRFLKQCSDIIGHLPSSLLPSEKLKPKIKIPAKEGKRGFRVVIYDMDSPHEEGTEIVPVWEGPIAVRSVPRLVEWIEIQTIAFQGIDHPKHYYYQNPHAPVDYGRERSDRLPDSPTNSIRERYRQINEEANRNRRRAADEVNRASLESIAERGRNMLYGQPETIDVSRHGESFRRHIIVESNPETPGQRWARDRWDRSLAGQALSAQAARMVDESGNVDDIKLSSEQDPDSNNRTKGR